LQVITKIGWHDYGNILYGAGGKAFGFESDGWLKLGATINQVKKFFSAGSESDKDTYSIQRGIDLYPTINKRINNIIKP